jgi:hypothetical protein
MDYRAYVVHDDGHFLGVHQIDAPNDSAAMAEAIKFADTCDIEVWHRDRHVGRIPAAAKQSKSANVCTPLPPALVRR